MNNAMKNIKLTTALCLLTLLLASCGKESKSKWTNFYGYTNEDIIGSYSYSNVEGAFDAVEGTGRHACPDAEVSITPYNSKGNVVNFSINCPEENFSRTFTGRPTTNSNDFMLHMSSGYQHYSGKLRAYNLTSYVFTDDEGTLRLHGYAAVNTYEVVHPYPDSQLTDTVTVDGVYYYFDVIKN